MSTRPIKPKVSSKGETMRKEALIRSASLEEAAREVPGSSRSPSTTSPVHSSLPSSREQSPTRSITPPSSTYKSWESMAGIDSKIMKQDARKFYQSAKDQLELSGNLKKSIKEQLLDDLYGLNAIITSCLESRHNVALQVEKLRAQHYEERLQCEKEYNRRIDELRESKDREEGPTPSEVMTELVALRQMIAANTAESSKLDPRLRTAGPSPTEIMGEIKALRQLVVMEGRKNSHLECPAQPNPDMAQLQADIRQLGATLSTTQAQLERIASESERIPPKLSYAEMARRPVSQSPRHSLIVSSSDPQDTSAVVLDKIRGAVDARSTGIRVDGVRKARDQKIVISCRTPDDISKIQARIKTKAVGLTVVEAQAKDPLVVIRDVLSYNTDEDIIGSLKSQNPNIFKDILDSENRVSVKYRRRARNRMESHIVLQVSTKLWQRLTSAGEVHIDLQRRPVYDQSPLIQCTRCLGFGHGRKLCKESVDKCSHCGEPHLRKDCPTWTTGGPPTCTNCKAAKTERSDHGAFNLDCPIRRRWDSIARSSVAYH